MNIQIHGTNFNSSTEANITPTDGAITISARPTDHVGVLQNGGIVLGHYRANLITGTTVNLASNAAVASFRWTATNAYAVLLRVEAIAQVASTITTGTLVDLEAIIARGFTASDSAQTAVTPGLGLKMRSLMGNSIIGDLRVSGAAGITAGTRTLDTVGFGFAAWSVFHAPTLGTTVNAIVNVGAGRLGDGWTDPKVLYQHRLYDQHPIILAANEGFICRNSTAGPTTGGIKYGITIEWIETPVY